MERTILHSDINNCYANIELLHRPELRGKPLAVGGDPEARHGIILAKDQLAKKVGVKTGMALWQAKKICPDIIIVPPRMDLYLRFSKMIHEIYADYTDLQESFGIDESWLDVTDSCSLKGDGLTIAKEIRTRIRNELGITVSIGVSWNKIFAKLGSDYKKPDAITVIDKSNYKNIVWPLPAEELLYVGRATKRKLNNYGIYTVGQLAVADTKLLKTMLGKMGIVLSIFANGEDRTPVSKENTSPPIKSIGNSTTTPRDLLNNTDIGIVIQILAESVSARLRENGFICNGIEISVRDNELMCFTRQRKLYSPTDITNEIAESAMSLFVDSYKWRRPIRSIGVRAISLMNKKYPMQCDIFKSELVRDKYMKIDRVIDDIRNRFGVYSIQRGMMLCDKNLSELNAKDDHVIYPHSYMERGNLTGVNEYGGVTL